MQLSKKNARFMSVLLINVSVYIALVNMNQKVTKISIKSMASSASGKSLQRKFEKEINISTLLDGDQYDDYNYCPDKYFEEHRKWIRHFLISKNDAPQIPYLPTKANETPINVAPMIPKTFLIEERDYCSKRPYLKSIAYVHSAISNVERRSVTRQTWGNASKEFGVVFVMGIAKNKEEEDIISRESQLYHDIVQGNYTDIYQLLVYKALNGLYWVTKNCNHVQWVTHADDDSLIDVFKYLHFVTNYKEITSHEKIFCHFLCYNAPKWQNSSKWYTSLNEFPYNSYPIYCMGNFWFTSMKVIKKLLNTVPLVKYLGIDDIYITGLVAEKAGITRYMTEMPNDFKEEQVGKHFGWIQLDKKRLQFWKKITSHYF